MYQKFQNPFLVEVLHKNELPQPLAWMQVSPVSLDSVWSNGKKRCLHADYYLQYNKNNPKINLLEWKLCPQLVIETFMVLLGHYLAQAVRIYLWTQFIPSHLVPPPVKNKTHVHVWRIYSVFEKKYIGQVWPEFGHSIWWRGFCRVLHLYTHTSPLAFFFASLSHHFFPSFNFPLLQIWTLKCP